jgi:hypothetical protein
MMNGKEIHYCKADLKTGTPINVTDSKTREVIKTDHWDFEGFDKEMNPIKFEIRFNNSIGKAKASGAKAVMKLIYL